MILHTSMDSPIGALTLAAKPEGLCGIYFQQHKPAPKRADWIEGDDGRFDEAKTWLTTYFIGETPARSPKILFTHGTPFQRRVWETLIDIPLGNTMTYGEIARTIGSEKASRAVGAAVGRNPLSIIVPCHRVIGSKAKLTGFAGGIQRKAWLLRHENAFPRY